MTQMKCFVIMPYQDPFSQVFKAVKEIAIRALLGEAIDCYWLKDIHAAGKITDDIYKGLHEAAFCIADVTGNNPNVMWETGYAMALGKPTILIGQCLESMPFDLKVHRVTTYRLDALGELAEPLSKAIQQTLAQYELKPDSHAPASAKGTSLVISVTGSMHADRARAQRRIETLLRPYLVPETMWYCGSNGTADESALEYLLANEQRVIAVAYHRYDFSEGARRLVQEGKVQFIDASLESLPKRLAGPSERDIFLCMKSDLVVLFWDGKSQGTETLIRYFEANGKNLLVGFI